MDSSQAPPKEVVLFVTGFGKFGKIIDNPTTVLVKALPELLKANPIEGLTLLHTEVVIVSIQGCDEALTLIYDKINQWIEEEGENQTKHYIVLHFGIYQGSGAFNIEQQGANLKHFFIPDENGNQPLNQCINSLHDLKHCLQTRLKVQEFARNLKSKGHKAKVSTDAGNYICNYSYYCSLDHRSKTIKRPEAVDALFCHVPSFKEIDEDCQKAFVLDLLQEIKDSFAS